ncbi:MAG TPA: PASTA domain-containing protein, partial [Acidimicrobiia bacterium]
LLALLGLMVFLVFQMAGGAVTPTTAPLVGVPNVVGASRAEALTAIQQAGLRVDLRDEASDDVAEGLVIRTEPGPATQLPSGSVVVVYVSSGSAPGIVPTLIGLTEEEATVAIEEAGFELGTVTGRPDAEAPAGEVIEQSPVAGIELDPGSSISLVLSEGPEDFALPDFSGFDDDEAFAQLQELGLEWNIDTESSTEFAASEVIRTEPGAGSLVGPGDNITVVVSTGPPPVTVPDVFGATIDAATTTLNQVGLQLRVEENTTIPVDDPALDDRIVQQNPTAGTQVQQGITVVVTLGRFEPSTTTTTTAN